MPTAPKLLSESLAKSRQGRWPRVVAMALVRGAKLCEVPTCERRACDHVTVALSEDKKVTLRACDKHAAHARVYVAEFLSFYPKEMAGG